MDRIPFDSTTIASAGYDPADCILELEFCSGAVYRYYSLPEAVYRDLLAADSKGRFFNQSIRQNFACQRVTGGGASA